MKKIDNRFSPKTKKEKNFSESLFLSKKRKKAKNNETFIENPRINYFNDLSHFIFDKKDSLEYFNNLA